MSIPQYAAIVATGVSALMVCFQLLLAAGLPLGQAAWGGKHTGVLPTNLRLGSLVAALIIGLAAWIVLTRAGLIGPGNAPTVVRIATWVFAGFMCLNTLGNLASKSPVERKVMTPVTLVLAACFITVALS